MVKMSDQSRTMQLRLQLSLVISKQFKISCMQGIVIHLN